MAKTHNVTVQCDFDSRSNYKGIKKVSSKGAYYCMYIVGTIAALDDAFARSLHIPLGRYWLETIEAKSDIKVVFKVGTFSNGTHYPGGYAEEKNGIKSRSNTIMADVVRGSNTDRTTNFVHTMLEQDDTMSAHLVMVWHSSFDKDETSEIDAESEVAEYVSSKFGRLPHNKETVTKVREPLKRRKKQYHIVY